MLDHPCDWNYLATWLEQPQRGKMLSPGIFERALAEDGLRAVALAVNSLPAERALWCLALAASAPSDNEASAPVRAAALAAMTPEISLNQLSRFVGYALERRGWGRSLKTAVARWFLARDPLTLVHEVSQPEDPRWPARDLLRTAHPKAARGSMSQIVHEWVLRRTLLPCSVFQNEREEQAYGLLKLFNEATSSNCCRC